MRPVGYGRPGTEVIPTGWQATHAPVITGTLDCTITIGPAGTAAAWNPDTEQTETAGAAPVYSGPAAIAVITDTAKVVDAVDEQTPVRRYEITLPVATAGIEAGHLVTVDASSDLMLTDATLTVATAERGGRRFSRVLQATLNH